MNSTNFSRISNVSPSSSIPCFIHVAPTPTHAKLKTDIYSFPTLGHRPGPENKEFVFSCNDYRNALCQHRSNLKTGFSVPPAMRLGPLRIPGARYATIVFHLFFPTKPAPAGGVGDLLECAGAPWASQGPVAPPSFSNNFFQSNPPQQVE